MSHDSTAPAIPFSAGDDCTGCGACAADCVASIITVKDGRAAVQPEEQEDCLGCQHCLAVCPTGAAGIAGLDAKNSRVLSRYDPDALDLLIRGRRSVRRFESRPAGRDLVDSVLETVSHAPTGINARSRRFTVVLDPGVLSEFRDRSCRALVEKRSLLPEDLSWLASAAEEWLEKGRDVIFRNAPHLIVCTASPGASTSLADCLIALSYFDLAATANGLGTVWCGMADYLLRHIPESRAWLGIPEDHAMGYAMLFGFPAVRYARTAQYKPEDVRYVGSLSGK